MSKKLDFLVKRIALEFGLTPEYTQVLLDTYWKFILTMMKDKRDISITGLGKYTYRHGDKED